MRYLLAVFLPPAAVLLCRQPGQVAVSVLLTACLWVPGMAHAMLITRATARRERADRVADAVLAHEERRARAPRAPARTPAAAPSGRERGPDAPDRRGTCESVIGRY